MTTSSGSMARKGRALALAASTMAAVTSPVLAEDFTQDQCKSISAITRAVVRHVGRDTLSIGFRQSLSDWMGPETRCDGPKEIAIVTENDSATYATIRSELLLLPKPISLQKAGLTPLVKSSATATPPAPQKRSEATPAPTVN